MHLIHRAQDAMRRHPLLPLVFLAATGVILYAVNLNSYFLQDDFYFIHFLRFNTPQILDGQSTFAWFIQLWSGEDPQMSGAVFFRPLVQMFFLADYLVWGLEPFGYHLTNLVLHVLTTCQVYFLVQLLTRRRLTALLAGLFFVVAPGPLEAVIWISGRTDLVCALFYLTGVVFFVLYRQQSRRLFGLLGLVSFALALGAKEMAVTLPLVLALYEALFVSALRRERVRAHLPYWAILFGYLGLRLALFGEIGGFRGAQLQDPFVLVIFYTRYLILPWSVDTPDVVVLVTTGALIVLLWLARASRSAWFGFLWMPITLLPVYASWPMSRYAYLPAVGTSLFIAVVLTRESQVRWVRVLQATAGALALVSLCSVNVLTNQSWARASQISAILPNETRKLHPSFPPAARLLYTGIPPPSSSGGSHSEFLNASLQIAYNDPTLTAIPLAKFPILAGGLENTYFIEYKRGHLIERTDLAEQLAERRDRRTLPSVLSGWEFRQDAEGWESWNQVADLRVENGNLSFRTDGDDPFIGSPPIAVPSMNLGPIEIRMRVTSDHPNVEGAIFWITSSDGEFLPDKQKTFEVRADGKFHKYTVNPDTDGNLFAGDNIIQLRLDPTDAPALVDIDYIRIKGYP